MVNIARKKGREGYLTSFVVTKMKKKEVHKFDLVEKCFSSEPSKLKVLQPTIIKFDN